MKDKKKPATPVKKEMPQFEIDQTSFRFHGMSLRGINFHPKSPSFEGRFGRMFRTLPPAAFLEDDLKKLAAAMVAPPEAVQTPETAIDAEENQGIDAGYTYLGQFLDHDLTFDPASSLQQQNDPEAIVNFRTPRFDLDCLYGRGPDDQPYLYQNDGLHLLLGRDVSGSAIDPNTRDLPRNTPRPGDPKRALIGDPRNDENVIVSQLQSTMLRFHNRVADFMTAPNGKKPDFRDVQKQVRWHYQWIVLHDFLPTIVGQNVIDEILPHLKNNTSIYVDKPKLSFFHWKESPFMPLEFSVAAYRFGHSMVRPIYRLNTTLADRFMIFSTDPNTSLTGFREFPAPWAIDWSLFFKMTDAPPTLGKNRLQKSYKIDTSLVDPLGNLPFSIGGQVPSLALRNLLRGWRMSLPSGQAVARQMHLPVIPDDKLWVGKATEEDNQKKNPKNKSITTISKNFAGNAPLWFYVLAEAQQAFDGHDSTTIRLGPVGGRIVAEVFIGLMLGDQYSFLSQEPAWRPFTEFLNNNEFKMADLIKQAIMSV